MSAPRRPQYTPQPGARRPLPTPAEDFDDDAQENGPDVGEMMSPPVHNREGGVAPVGFYICEIEKISQETQTLYQDYIRLRWHLRVLSVISARDRQKAREMIGQVITAWCNLATGPKAAFRRWAEAAFDRKLAEDEQFPLSQLYGCIIEVSVVPHIDKEQRETTKVEGLSAYRPEELDEAQKPPSDTQPQQRLPATAPRASAQEMAGRPAPPRQEMTVARAVTEAMAPEPAAAPPAEDAFTEPWDDDPIPGAVDPVLAARAARPRR